MQKLRWLVWSCCFESTSRDRGLFDQNSLDRNCVLSVDQNFHNQLTKIFETFHLIEIFNNEFDQTPKN